ncbi:Argonaute complex, subunit Arb1 [Aspergillus avenaceus]|uniref:Argonaute complex, subunit Arb1 n=1 Tax=Aspergillus avenaceus TaxID=36643 RepID=A0A5N6TS19_ASPAV|nr:Argonaute complex, subunit Arb1 [Aspergillus avenaceus]
MNPLDESSNTRDLPFRPHSDVGSDQQPIEPASDATNLPAENMATSAAQSTSADVEQDMSIPVDLIKPKKKKKRSSKPKSKRGKNKPTGFEEYYVDAPMTPDEYAEEKSIYDISRPIAHRIEDALLRYEKNRRLEPERREVFLRYLAYGGVDTGPKMFAGVDNRELQQMDSEQILVAKGQTSIRDDHSHLPIDFDAVAKGYLTSYFPYYFNPDTEEMMKLATVTIRNFLSYILYHEVCPEHKENIERARISLDIANKELWKNQQFAVKSPGDFNTACSTLFGGFFNEIHVDDSCWKNPKDDSNFMSNDVARKVVKFALAGAGSNSQAHRFQELATQDALRAMLVEDIHGFEVTAVCPPDPDVREFYNHYASDLNPVGRMLARAYHDPGKPPYDLSPEEREEWENGCAPNYEFEFFLEENLLDLCYPGMKVITPVWQLNCGMHYFEDVHTAYCSNYTVLANDLMLGWKKPRVLGVGEKNDADDSGAEDNGGAKKE